MAHVNVAARLIATPGEESKAEEGHFIQQMRHAPLSACKDIVSLIKKEIKSKSSLPQVKLRALNLFHSCMLLKNYDFANFAAGKITKRLVALAKHRKNTNDPNRGCDLFGPLSTCSIPNAEASSEFLRNLLTYLRIWSHEYPVNPNLQPSTFAKAVNSLLSQGIRFPNESRQSITRPSVLSQTQTDVRSSLRPRTGSVDISRKGLIRISETDLENVYTTAELIEDVLCMSGDDRETLDNLSATMNSHISRLDAELRAQGISHDLDTQEKVTKAKECALGALKRIANSRVKGRATLSPQTEKRKSPPSRMTVTGLSEELERYGRFVTMGKTVGARGDRRENVGATRDKGDTGNLESQLAAAMRDLERQDSIRLKLQMSAEQIQSKYDAHMSTFSDNLPSLEADIMSLQAECDRKDREIESLTAEIQAVSMNNQRLRESLDSSHTAYSSQPRLFQSNLQQGSVPVLQAEEMVGSQVEYNNEREFGSVWFAERGVLADNDVVKVMFQVKTVGAEARLIISIGNKPPGTMNNFKSTVIPCTDGLFIAMIDKEVEESPVAAQSQVMRRIKITINDFSGEIPEMRLTFEKGQKQIAIRLLLPITLFRFFSSPNSSPSALLSYYRTLLACNETIPLPCISSTFGSLGDLVAALSGRDNLQTLSNRDCEEIGDKAVMCVGKLWKVGVFLIVSFPPAGKIEVRTNEERIRGILKKLITTLLVRS